MHAKIITNMLQQIAKMVPKWLQNLSKIDPGGALEATWEPPLKQDASKTSFFDDFGSIFGLHLGPVWFHCLHHVLMFFLSGFLMALVSIWAPKTPPK